MRQSAKSVHNAIVVNVRSQVTGKQVDPAVLAALREIVVTSAKASGENEQMSLLAAGLA